MRFRGVVGCGMCVFSIFAFGLHYGSDIIVFNERKIRCGPTTYPRQRPSNLTVPPSLYELAETMLDNLNSPRHWRTRSMTSVAWKLEGESKGHFVWEVGP
jgi:hypothetical protein